MQIAIHPLKDSELKPMFTDPAKLGFCKSFTDRMFTMLFSETEGWHSPEIKKFGPLSFEPSTCVLHYSQEIFEGLKAFSTTKGEINLFRPEMNARRFNRSATRLCMPNIPESDFIESIETLINLEKRWIPKSRGAALYIRPFMIGIDNILGVRASSNYLYCVILSPVGSYYQEGFNPISLYVTTEYSRAAKGGLGEAKTGGNYAASLLAGRVAREKGCAQVLWLDPIQHRNIEEVGAMNIFFVFNNELLVTPKLNGSILAGVTRDSVLTLAKHLGLKTEEREISIDEVVDGITAGTITESFGSGTAASVSPVGNLKYNDKDYEINNRLVGPIAQRLYDYLLGIQYGETDDPFHWIRKVKMQEKAALA
ncbi:MAG: branched-chain amino acid aminotransferase [Candidatus Riflebacteria bacterium]|nr:branched-chain amino acid aminotransferase [Candidatus Riflebacteria bacterium]